MESSNATAVCPSHLHGHGPTIMRFGKPPDAQLFAGLQKLEALAGSVLIVEVDDVLGGAA